MLPFQLQKLIDLLAQFPGVGQRSATRWGFYIMGKDRDYADELGKTLLELFDSVKLCEECHQLSEHRLCGICENTAREQKELCIVESIPDLMALERSGSYFGLYHVLHGQLSPLKGIGPDELQLQNLEARILAHGVEEVIVATSASVEGEATAHYLGKRLSPLKLTLSRIATGIPMGGELEYLDEHTLERAFRGRTPLR